MRLHRVLGSTIALLCTLQAWPCAMADELSEAWRDRSPHRSDFASVNGVRLHYLDWGGNGPPLLLLAGLFGAAHGILPTIQGGGEIAISSITQTASHLQLNVGAIGASYEGDLKDGQVTGTWSQGPASLPLVFNRTQK